MFRSLGQEAANSCHFKYIWNQWSSNGIFVVCWWQFCIAHLHWSLILKCWSLPKRSSINWDTFLCTFVCYVFMLCFSVYVFHIFNLLPNYNSYINYKLVVGLFMYTLVFAFHFSSYHRINHSIIQYMLLSEQHLFL